MEDGYSSDEDSLYQLKLVILRYRASHGHCNEKV